MIINNKNQVNPCDRIKTTQTINRGFLIKFRDKEDHFPVSIKLI